MAKTAYQQLLDLLDDDTKSKVQAKLAENPKLIAEDTFTTELFGIYKGIETAEPGPAAAAASTSAIPSTTATVTPSLPSAASTTAAAQSTAQSTTASPVPNSAELQSILASLTGLKTTMDTKLANVITKDQLPTLGSELVQSAAAQALAQSNELAEIRELHRDEFGKKLDAGAFRKFVEDAQDPATKRNKYATLTDAYNAMVSVDRENARIAKGIADGLTQANSGREVPGQTTSTALSPAQQVMAKARAANNGGDKTNLQKAIDALAARERANANAEMVQ